MPYMHPNAAGHIEGLMFDLGKRGAGDAETRFVVRQAMAGMWSLAYDTGYCQGWSDKGADLAAEREAERAKGEADRA
jgi:hypothetical protein